MIPGDPAGESYCEFQRHLLLSPSSLYIHQVELYFFGLGVDGFPRFFGSSHIILCVDYIYSQKRIGIFGRDCNMVFPAFHGIILLSTLPLYVHQVKSYISDMNGLNPWGLQECAILLFALHSYIHGPGIWISKHRSQNPEILRKSIILLLTLPLYIHSVDF